MLTCTVYIWMLQIIGCILLITVEFRLRILSAENSVIPSHLLGCSQNAGLERDHNDNVILQCTWSKLEYNLII